MASIRRHPKSGRWQVRYRDTSGRQRSKTYLKKADADKFASVVEADKLRGTWADPRLAKTPFAEWWEQHTAAKVHLKPATLARTESIGRNHLLPTFGSMQLGAITKQTIRTWVSGLVSRSYAPGTIRKAYQLLSSALEAAVDEGLLPHSPARGISLPRGERKEMRFLSTEEVARLADAIDPRYQAMVYTAAYTGLRLGELTGLAVEHVEFLNRRLRVMRSLSEVKGKLSFTDTKTSGSRRTIQLPAFLVDILAAHIAEYPDPSGLVFTSPEGGPIRQTNFRRRHWTPAVRASVGEPCRFHDLRHTHAALLIRQGEHPKVIQSRLGHSSITTTLDTYGHLFDGLDEAAADRLDQVFADSHVDTMWTLAGA